jgi:tetratricopeptide (TPR) repeat protein
MTRCLPVRTGALMAATALALLAPALPAFAQSPVARSTPVAGSIVDAKGGEEMRFAREEAWRWAGIKQDILGGDTLRTNTIGTLGLLFADQTMIRVGRQSTLVVNEVASENTPTELTLPVGNVWARANRGGSSVVVKTPAAAAAIRGTDWSLTVDGSGRTGLVVLEGEVVLSNPQGSVTVRQGEGATAAIGQAPTKIVLVRPKDREQMLFHLSLRDAFTTLPASPIEGRQLRQQRAQLEQRPAEARSAEDWLTLAETRLRLEGTPAAQEALARARAQGLNASQRARAVLLDALFAGAERNYKEAAALFAKARPGLSGRRAIVAEYGRYIAASLADPRKVQPRPRFPASDPWAVMADAYVTGFAEDLQAAAAILKKNEARHGGNVQYQVLSAQVALTLDRREEMKAAVDRAKAIDPDDPDTLLASGYLRADIDSDIDGAIADLRRATEIAPGNSENWNALGLALEAKDATLEAEEALKRAIAVDPNDPVPLANYAILLLDQSRLDEAIGYIDKALALDPGFYVAYTAKGRYFLQKGDQAKGLEFLLAGSAANPAYAQGLLGVAIAQYQAGDEALAQQAFDNADRLDPNDPVTALARTAIAIDQDQADQAILNAREAVRRFRARGGYFSPLATTRQGGSYLADAYRLIDLDQWGRFYGDRVFDPFEASGYFDQAQNRRYAPFFTRQDPLEGFAGQYDLASLNLVLQGALLDPLAVSGRIGRIDLLRRPFLDVEIGGSVIARDGKTGWAADVNVQGYSNDPTPVSFSAQFGTVRTSDPRKVLGEEAKTATVFVGVEPSAANRLLFWGTATQNEPDLSVRDGAQVATDGSKQDAAQVGAGFSHTFGYRNVLNAAVVGTRASQLQDRSRSYLGSLDFFGFQLPTTLDTATREKATVDSVVATIGHSYGIDDVTLRYGAEGQFAKVNAWQSQDTTLAIPIFAFTNATSDFARTDSNIQAGRLYADAFWRPSDRFEAQAGLQGVQLRRAGETEQHLDPRIGVAVSPIEGQWLRAMWRQDSELVSGSFTLAPIATVGLIPNTLPVTIGSRTETAAVRWDAEWTSHLFTAVDYQHQKIDGLSIGVPDTLDSLPVVKGTVDTVAASANIWLPGGIGVFGTVGASQSDNKTPGLVGRDIPCVPDRFARAGFTFLHPSRIRFTLATTYVGERAGDLLGAELKAFATTDAYLSYETPDRRLYVSFAVLNIFDRQYDLAPGSAASVQVLPNNPVLVSTPAVAPLEGSGRTFVATVKGRF